MWYNGGIEKLTPKEGFMRTCKLDNMTLSVDFAAGHITSLIINGVERVAAATPLFRLRLRDEAGQAHHYTAYDASLRTPTDHGGIFTGFPAPFEDLTVTVSLTDPASGIDWCISVAPNTDKAFAEWVDFPRVTLPDLKRENPEAGGEILLPYTEGILVSSHAERDVTDFRFWEPEYPSLGCYSLFPNMVSSQMMAYLWADCGLYVGLHDPKRGVKALDFFRDGENTTIQPRIFCGAELGETYTTDYPVIWKATDGRWESAAEIYRVWFEANLPPKARKVAGDDSLPAWYEDSPLIVTYPVRGWHDTDDMSPNPMFPYVSALPILDRIRSATESRLMVILMHWEGTAPWAPPFVWPPYGGVENFNAFKTALHDRNDMLGVYCSGFGYTMQSHLTDYSGKEFYEKEGLEDGMCVGPNGQITSKICTAQREGYDICPASPVGRKLLDEAYAPLFEESGLDYVQILDQNHGGGQYFCYAKDHGHPPAPGAWMTQSMQDMLGGWNEKAPSMLFGCESAAAEPFIGNLRFSDNRYELNYFTGRPVPLYAYLYHEYLRNFMGNQVCGDLRGEYETLCHRIGYSFAAGDCLTLVLAPDGRIQSYWGQRDLSDLPEEGKVLTFIRNLTRFYREEAKPYLYAGRMIPALPVECPDRAFIGNWGTRPFTLPILHSTAWEAEDGSRVQILVNPEDFDVECRVGKTTVTVPALSAKIFSMEL